MHVLSYYMWWCLCLFAHPLHDAVYNIPQRSKGSDKEDPDSADGHGPDEGARERPRDASGPAVQLGPVLRQHSWTETDLAGQHGPSTLEKWRPLWGTVQCQRRDYFYLLWLPTVACVLWSVSVDASSAGRVRGRLLKRKHLTTLYEFVYVHLPKV